MIADSTARTRLSRTQNSDTKTSRATPSWRGNLITLPLGVIGRFQPPMMNTLSEYIAAAGNRLLPGEVVEHAKHHLLDTLASMISGSELPAGQAAERYIRAHGGKGTATIAGAALTAAPVDAALANGVMAHADETDDSHNASRSHPGCAAAEDNGVKLFCPPVLNFEAAFLASLLDQEIREPLSGVPWKDDTPIELIMVYAFVDRFPCKK